MFLKMILCRLHRWCHCRDCSTDFQLGSEILCAQTQMSVAINVSTLGIKLVDQSKLLYDTYYKLFSNYSAPKWERNVVNELMFCHHYVLYLQHNCNKCVIAACHIGRWVCIYLFRIISRSLAIITKYLNRYVYLVVLVLYIGCYTPTEHSVHHCISHLGQKTAVNVNHVELWIYYFHVSKRKNYMNHAGNV